MEVTFDCPYCDQSISADTTAAEGRTTCPACHEAVLIPAAGIRPGMMLGDFKIEKCLGVGGMGEVFLATQVAMDRKVALKVLPPALTGNKTLVQRFLNEIRMAGKLEHPNIVTAFYAGEDSGYNYLAMSYVEGEDLEVVIKRDGRIPEKQALEICLKIARGLDYAWNTFRLLHRDIKPANIMLDKANEVKLMDMGIAKALTEDNNLTTAGVMVGTPFYMSPEQAKNIGEVDCRTDIYALGGTLYHMITGTRPYEGPTAISVVAKHLNDPVPAAHLLFPSITLPTGRLIAMMMAKEVEDRPDDWKQLIETIEDILAGRNPATLELKTAELATAGLLDQANPDATIGIAPSNTAPGMAPPTIAPTSGVPPTEYGAVPQQRPSATMAEYVDALPANPELPKSLKAALLVVALLVIAFISVVVLDQALDLRNQQEDAKLERKLREDGKAAEQQEQAGSIEAGIVAVQTRTELTEVEKLKDARIKKMITTAQDYEKKHPEKIRTVLANYISIMETAKGTAHEIPVRDAIERVKRLNVAVAKIENMLVGEWVSTRSHGPNAQANERLGFTFKADGTFIMTRNGAQATGNWRVSPAPQLHLYVNEKQVLAAPIQPRPNSMALTWKEGHIYDLKRL